jgi:hypothetical protein
VLFDDFVFPVTLTDAFRRRLVVFEELFAHWVCCEHIRGCRDVPQILNELEAHHQFNNLAVNLKLLGGTFIFLPC